MSGPDVWSRPVEGKPREAMIRLVLVGVFYDDKRKPLHRFARCTVVDEKVDGRIQGELGGEIVFSVTKETRKLKSPGTVWDVVEVTGDDGKATGWRIASATFVGRYGPGGSVDTVVRWEADQVARDAAIAAAVRTEKAQADTPTAAALETLRTAYRSQVGANRAQVLAFFVKEITR